MAATAMIILGTGVNALGFYPEGPILLLVGSLISIIWQSSGLIVTNATYALIGLGGLAYTYLN